MSRRGATTLSGILPIDKPSGMTSHDVVSVVRRVTGERRVGHAGTLDPMATGVLVVLVGPATRLAPYLTAADKAYDARIVFGTATDTDDSDGMVTQTRPVPPELGTEERAIVHVAGLVGRHDQIPPAFSALKRGGVIAHRAARVGEPLQLDARSIQITDALLLGVEPGPPIAWNISLVVSKGTYVRAIARDLGHDLGTVAHLSTLTRTRSGAIDLDRTTPLATIESIPAAESAGGAVSDEIEALFLPAREALELPTADVDDDAAEAVSVGKALQPELLGREPIPDGTVAVMHEGRLLAVYLDESGALRPLVVFPGGVS